MENRFEKLNAQVIDWAKEKGILEKATPLAQAKKTLEEVNELIFALTLRDKKNITEIKSDNGDVIFNAQNEVIDAFGDILVTVLIGCKMQGIDPLDALETAYNVIAKRTGEMRDGVFVKSEDL